MRVYKFRAICNDADYGNEEYYLKMIYSETINQIAFGDEVDEVRLLVDGKWLKVKKETVCQYTGLKDRRGTEIYEGDIVIFNHIKDEYPEVENIFFHNVNRTEYQKKYVAEFCNTYYRYGLRFRNGSTHFMVVQATITNHNVEVIGNIYENPELLEGREA